MPSPPVLRPWFLAVSVLLLAAVAAVAVRHGGRPAPAVTGSGALPVTQRFHATPWDQGLPHRGQWRQGFVLADLDGDGHVDLVHGPPRKGPAVPQVFRGDGHGHWEPWTTATFPAFPYDYGDVAVADFTGDGRADLALGMHLRGLVVLQQEADGVFQAVTAGLPAPQPGPPVVAAGFSSRALAAADWNGDGRPDLLALGDGPRPTPGGSGSQSQGFRVYVNHAAEGWRHAPGPVDAAFGDALALGDVDGDGHLDAVVSSSVMGLKAVLRLGQGDTWRAAELPGLPARVLVRGVAVGDLDGDGRADILLATTHVEDSGWKPRVRRYALGTSGWQEFPLLELPPAQEAWALALGDADGDGALDVAVGLADGTTLLLAGDGHGGFTRDLELPAPEWRAGCRAAHLEFANLDDVHGMELAGSFAGEADGPGAPCASGGGLQVWQVRAAP